jgi:iron complex transport system ATP-binding protein
MAPDSTVPLSTENLSIGYAINKKENFLFHNLNLHLPAGQLVCFMGPNGIGKSTLIRTLAGLQKPLSGSVKINPDKEKNSISRSISVVLTDKISALNMTAYEVVAFGRYPYLDWNINLSDADKIIIDRSISQVHIEHLVNQHLHSLSDGQLQMVMIARALAQETPIILLDEPTAHLDLNNRVEIMKLLRQLAKTTRKAILVSTHDLDLALQMADLIWLTGRDKGIHTGIPEDLVLDGSFDRIFEFKGFDLKTGKVHHEAYTRITIQLTGEGSEYLWTKNALERSGFEVSEQTASIRVTILKQKDSLRWKIEKEGYETRCDSLADLIKSI